MTTTKLMRDRDRRPSLRGFRSVLKHFNESNDLSYRGTNWFIAKGGYDLSFQIEYRTACYGWTPYIDCISWHHIYRDQQIDDDVFLRMMQIMHEVFEHNFIEASED